MWDTDDTMESPSRRAPRETVAAIRDAALRLFVELGYENASVGQIVETAGVTKGAMYHHFRSKNELLFGIYDRLLAVQFEHLQTIAAGEGSAGERLRAAMVDLVLTSLEWRDEAIVFLHSRHLLEPDQRREVARRRREYDRAFRGLVREAVAEGAVRSDREEVVIGGIFFGAVHYLGDWYDPVGPLSPERIAQEYADVILSGLRPTA